MEVTLKSSGMSRYKSDHPWLFANQLRAEALPAGMYNLVSERGEWLGRGLYNPRSKISFRMMTKDKEFQALTDKETIQKLLELAIGERSRWTKERLSCRLVHGEADRFSGLLIDAFFLENSLVYVVQSQAAGVDAILPIVLESLKTFGPDHIIVKNDSSKRRREGIEVEEGRVIYGGPIEDGVIRVGSIEHPDMLVNFKVNLLKGQKTGFFLDQSFNIDAVFEHIRRSPFKSVQLLDVCSYVGQWSAKLTKGLLNLGVQIVTTALDVSREALENTKLNVEAVGGTCQTQLLDVIKGSWDEVPIKAFDVVISDPPALIKSRKDLKPGQHGYLKLNTQSIMRVKEKGLFVACSCSGVLSREDFKKTLNKASQRAGRKILWVGEGRQSPDHPIRDWFPEGEYLKCFIGRLLD